jgi:hypothetical protein
MLQSLRTHDAQLIELHAGRGSLLIPPALGGRLFCQLDGELIHRLDAAAMRNPSPEGYDNLGGNSLWPAPEGGPFAFNYPPDSDAWYVQDGVSKAIPSVTPTGPREARVEKTIGLINRKGIRLDLQYRRAVSVMDLPPAANGYALSGLAYTTDDSFEPLEPCSAQQVLLAPWSLEQFPGAEGILAFGKVSGGPDALNCDFYGDPGDRIAWHPWGFTFRLGGTDRHQIGLRVKAQPECIGALDSGRSLLFLRKTQPQAGLYFNIADNEQPDGPLSAADLFSIFNGGELGFFELETIGAMQSEGGLLSTSTLQSQTLVLKGTLPELRRYLAEREGVVLDSMPRAVQE